MSEEKLYVPSAWQQEFHDLTVHEALGAGAAGPGKSLCLLNDCNTRILAEHRRCTLPKNDPLRIRPGQSKGWALHLRRTFPMLKQTLARAHVLFKAMDQDVKYDADACMFTFYSGYKYQFGHCQNPDDWEKYQSNQYDWIGFDELTQFTEEQYDQIKTRLRSSDPVLMKMLYVRAMSNPLMRRAANENFVVHDPHWVRRRFVDPWPAGRRIIRKEIRKKGGERAYRYRVYLPASLYDNPDKDYVKQYEEQLLDSPEHIRQALLYGDWYATPDAFFGQWWNQQIHVVEPFRVPEDWPLFRVLDWGFRSQGVVLWFAVDRDDSLFCVHELNFKEKRPREVAQMILDVEAKLGVPSKRGSRLIGVADNQLWEDKGDTGQSKAEEMAQAGVSWLKANKARRQRNAELVVARLKAHGKGMTRPGLVFFRNCVQTIKTLPSIGTDPKNSECPADGGEDHWADCVMYGCEFASRPRASIPREERDVFDDEDEAIQRTGTGYFR